MHSTRRSLAAVAAAAAVTAGGLAPANAATWSHDDAVGDVVRMTWEDDESEPSEVIDPDNTSSDVTRVWVGHGRKRVLLEMRLRDITARSGVALYHLRTAARNYWVVQRLGRDEEVPKFMLMRGNGRPVRCSGVEHMVLRDAEVAAVGIPRRCLGRPAWVRVGAGVNAWEYDRRSFTDWYDDAQREGEIRDRLKLSPRIHRG